MSCRIGMETDMELRTLRYFVHVADARSFSKASVFLRVAQPALSRQIRKLEDEIGMPLFVRAGRAAVDAGMRAAPSRAAPGFHRRVQPLRVRAAAQPGTDALPHPQSAPAQVDRGASPA